LWQIIKKSLKTPKQSFNPKEILTPTGFKGPLKVDDEKCNGCQKCSKVCPVTALTNDFPPKYEILNCLFCGRCVEICERGALSFTTEFNYAQLNQDNLEFKGIQLKKEITRVFGRSLTLRHLDSGSCNGCDWELVALTNSFYDIQRFGVDFVASPRHADGVIVTGPVTEHLAQAVKKTYHATPDPKFVIAVGTCAVSGGLHKNSLVTRGRVGNILPVDLFIPGCPPHPLTIIDGLLKLLKKSPQY